MLGRRYKEKRKEVLEQARDLYTRGNKRAALRLLEEAYEKTQDDEYINLISMLQQQGMMSMGGPMPEVEDDYSPSAEPPRPRVDHGQRAADIARRGRESSISRGSAKGFLKEMRKTIHGLGTLVTGRIFKGEGRSITEDATTMVASCKCRIEIDAIAGVCSICNGEVCSKHLYECAECNELICNKHMRRFDGEPYCIPHYQEQEWMQREITDQWELHPEPPPDSPLLRMWDNFWGRKQLPGKEED